MIHTTIQESRVVLYGLTVYMSEDIVLDQPTTVFPWVIWQNLATNWNSFFFFVSETRVHEALGVSSIKTGGFDR